jgi:hypothetical protein
MLVPLPSHVWVVEPNDETRALLREIAPQDAELMDDQEFRRRIDRGARPNALLIDGTCLLQLDGQRPALEGIVRTLIVTGRAADALPRGYLRRPSVQFLRKPFHLHDMERAMRWLTGGADEGWADLA